MPFAVRQWPASPDPRSPAFAIDGWDFGQVPPFTWIMATTGATGIYTFLNDGLLLRNSFASPGSSFYEPIIPPPFFVVPSLVITGFQSQQVGPPPWTISFDVLIVVETTTAFTGQLRQLFPTAIQVQSPMAMVVVSPTDGTIPNAVSFTPAIWDAE